MKSIFIISKTLLLLCAIIFLLLGFTTCCVDGGSSSNQKAAKTVKEDVQGQMGVNVDDSREVDTMIVTKTKAGGDTAAKAFIPPKTIDAEAHMRQGDAFYDQGMYEEALKEYNKSWHVLGEILQTASGKDTPVLDLCNKRARCEKKLMDEAKNDSDKREHARHIAWDMGFIGQSIWQVDPNKAAWDYYWAAIYHHQARDKKGACYDINQSLGLANTTNDKLLLDKIANAQKSLQCK